MIHPRSGVRIVMKLLSGLVLASASLLSLAAHAATPDAAPTLVTDAQGTTLTGAHHLNGAAFSLIVTDWWLTGAVPGGPAQGVRLIVEVHMPSYPLLDRATDAAGRKLDVAILNRGPSARWRKKASERVAVVLPFDYAQQARVAGVTIIVSGKDQSFPIAVPGPVLTAFLDSYLTAIASDTTPANTAPVPAAPSPPPTVAAEPPVPNASSPSVAAAPSTTDAVLPPAPQAPQPVKPTTADPFPVAPPPTAAEAAAPSQHAAAPVSAPRPFPQIPDAPHAPVVSLPGDATIPDPDSTPPPAPDDAASSADTPSSPDSGHGFRVGSLGLLFVPTSSGAMVLLVTNGSIAASKGIESGDFIEAVDGVPIKTLSGDQMAAKIGAPGVKVLHMIAAGDVKIR
jgi:hypothetical protein